MTTQNRERALEILRSKALTKTDEPIQLASGEYSQFFVDGKEGLSDWPDLELVASVIVESVHDAGINFNAVGGLTLGASPLTFAVSQNTRCRWFLVRKEPKQRGTKRWIEGHQIGTGDQVLLVDDVVTSGGSILKAYDLIVETGATVVAAVTLVDRGEIAKGEFDRLGVPYFPLATYEALGIPPVGDVGRRAPATV